MANQWSYVNVNGRVVGVTGSTQPSALETTTAAGSGATAQEYFVGVDDMFNDYTPNNLGFSTVTNSNSNGYSFNYLSEYYLLLDSGNNKSFVVGEPVTQVIPGIDFDAVCTSFSLVKSGEWSWKWKGTSNQNVTTSALMTIAECGPTSGTASAGPTAPTGGTAGFLGGPGGCGGTPIPIVGASSAASWDVIGISRRIHPWSLGNKFRTLEIDAVTADDYSSLIYTDGGGTIDMTNSSTDLQDLYNTVTLNHTIYGSTHANYINTVTVYDTNNIAVTVDAVSGGTPDTSVSELNTLYYVHSIVGDAAAATKDAIHIAYIGLGTSAGTDSVRKVRQFYADRNP